MNENAKIDNNNFVGTSYAPQPFTPTQGMQQGMPYPGQIQQQQQPPATIIISGGSPTSNNPALRESSNTVKNCGYALIVVVILSCIFSGYGFYENGAGTFTWISIGQSVLYDVLLLMAGVFGVRSGSSSSHSDAKGMWVCLLLALALYVLSYTAEVVLFFTTNLYCDQVHRQNPQFDCHDATFVEVFLGTLAGGFFIGICCYCMPCLYFAYRQLRLTASAQQVQFV